MTALNDDERGELCWIETSRLFVPEEYQRPLLEDHARAIARNFEWRVFGVIVVSEREGDRYAIVDGQNRCRAASLRGVYSVPCIVHRFASLKDEARVFDALNSQRRAVNVWGRQKSQFFQGDPVAIAADKFITDIGTKYVPLATIRYMAARFPAELTRLTPLIKEMLSISATPLRQDFVEGICVLEAMLGERSSLTDRWRFRCLNNGYDDCLDGMREYQDRNGRFCRGYGAYKQKADALLYALNTRVTTVRGHHRRLAHAVKIVSETWGEDVACDEEPIAAAAE